MATKKQQAEYRKSQAKSKLAWGIAFFFAIVWLVIALVPFLFMILNSFRKQFDMLSQGVFHLPDPGILRTTPTWWPMASLAISSAA